MKPLILIILLSITSLSFSQSKKHPIIGIWQTKAPQGFSVIYHFKDSKNVSYSYEVPEVELSGRRITNGKYTIDSSGTTWKIDIYGFNDPSQHPKDARFLGIIELMKNGKLKLEGVSSAVGKRPKKFSNKAHIFTRVKESK